MSNAAQSYKKYKWFFTSSGKLVVGGKSAEQNEQLIKELKREKRDYIMMHTKEPGSPFSVILSEKNKISRKDKHECAVFTACFSKAWKAGKKKTIVHIFSQSQLFKERGMKTGTWGIIGDAKEISVPLTLVLTKQKGALRAVPPSAAKRILAKIYPGKEDKINLLPKFENILKDDFNKEELLSALPSGGINILR